MREALYQISSLYLQSIRSSCSCLKRSARRRGPGLSARSREARRGEQGAGGVGEQEQGGVGRPAVGAHRGCVRRREVEVSRKRSERSSARSVSAWLRFRARGRKKKGAWVEEEEKRVKTLGWHSSGCDTFHWQISEAPLRDGKCPKPTSDDGQNPKSSVTLVHSRDA